MAKRTFKVSAGKYGGELVIGEIPEGLMEDLLNSDDLVEAIMETDFTEWDLPDLYWEIDNFEHINNVYADCEWTVTEDDGDEKSFECDNMLYEREAYMYDEKWESRVPALIFMSEEKGSFGEWIVETDGEDFDPSKFVYSTVDTTLGTFVEDAWYDKKLLELDTDYADSCGNGYQAKVGWFEVKDHDTKEKMEKYMDEYWEAIEE
jgi:hypothetical protein